MTSTLLAPATKRKPPSAGKGRTKGVPNKVTAELKDMIRQALENAGGVEYLVARAHDPKTAPAFLSLLGKILPLQLTGSSGRTLAEELAGLRNMPQIHGDSGTA